MLGLALAESGEVSPVPSNLVSDSDSDDDFFPKLGTKNNTIKDNTHNKNDPSIYGGSATDTLRSLAAKRGIFLGSGGTSPVLLTNASDPVYSTFLAKQFSLVTPGNACKWVSVHPEKDSYYS